jgi:hypothetical protein
MTIKTYYLCDSTGDGKQMEKIYKAMIIVLSIVVINVFLWINRFPNLHGNDVDKITISDYKGRVLSHWFIDPNKKWWSMSREDKNTKNAMQQVLNAFKITDKLVERNQIDPNYWVHIETKTGSSMDKLVWLKKGEKATFVNSALGEPLSMLQSYLIPDLERDKMFYLIEANNSQ